MRDDRYKGTSIPRAMRKLCRMSEREADRCQPDRLKAQAVMALVSEGAAISSEFRARLVSHDVGPSLFSRLDLVRAARSGLEVQIVRNLDLQSSGTEAVAAALRERSAAYVREQKSQLIADREGCASRASDAVKKACDDAASDAASLILTKQRPPANTNRVHLDENLLGHAASGGRP